MKSPTHTLLAYGAARSTDSISIRYFPYFQEQTLSPSVTPRFKKPRQNSEKHLKLIRQLPSCLTFSPPPNDPHHLRCAGGRGIGLKAEDRWTVPMTRREHSDCHLVGSKRELEWFAERGIDVTALATELWEASGNLDQMTNIIRKYYNGNFITGSPR